MDPGTGPGELEAALSSGVAPDLLVPCDVAGMGSASAALRQEAAVLETAGAALSRVEVTSWRGRAADGFTEILAPEPSRWRAAADSLTAGAGARVDQQQQAAAAGGTAAALALDAESLRRTAIETLARARRVVLSAGDLAAATLARAAETAPQARRFWESTIRPADAVAVGHSTLDALGMIPALGVVPDTMNAGWYAMKGDGVNAAMSAAGMLPILGDTVLAGRIARNLAIRPATLTRGLANPVPEVLFIAGNRNAHNFTPRSWDVTGLSTFDNLDAPIFRPGTKVQPLMTDRLKDLRIWGPDGPNGHYSVRPQEERDLLAWMESRDKAVPHHYSDELISSLARDFKIPRPGG